MVRISSYPFLTCSLGRQLKDEASNTFIHVASKTPRVTQQTLPLLPIFAPYETPTPSKPTRSDSEKKHTE